MWIPALCRPSRSNPRPCQACQFQTRGPLAPRTGELSKSHHQRTRTIFPFHWFPIHPFARSRFITRLVNLSFLGRTVNDSTLFLPPVGVSCLQAANCSLTLSCGSFPNNNLSRPVRLQVVTTTGHSFLLGKLMSTCHLSLTDCSHSHSRLIASSSLPGSCASADPQHRHAVLNSACHHVTTARGGSHRRSWTLL